MKIIFLFLNILVWAFPTIFITLLKKTFDLHTQNFYRYLVSTTFFIIALPFLESVSWRKESRRIKSFILPALILTITQTTWVAGIELTSATSAALLSKISIIMVVFLSCLVFPDERVIARSRDFAIGGMLAIVGVIGLVAGKNHYTLNGFTTGTVLIIVSRLGWSLYSITLKKVIQGHSILLCTTYVLGLSTLLFLPMALLWGDLSKIREASIITNLVLFGSGLICVGTGQILFQKNIRLTGIVITTVFLLLTPLVTGIIAFIILGETLTMGQIYSGLLILVGCYFAIRKSRLPHPSI